MAKAKPVEQLDRVIIRFAGDSGDGMQLTGDRFTSETAMLGNDLATFPDFPAEIRAPAGSLPGVSGFQVHFADHDILTPGDQPERARRDEPGRAEDEPRRPAEGRHAHRQHATRSTTATCRRRATRSNPLEDGSLDDYHVHEVALTSMTVEALKGIEGDHARARRSARRTSSRSA